MQRKIYKKIKRLKFFSDEQVRIGEAATAHSTEASIGREEHEEHDHHHHQRHQSATAAFDISRPSNPISAIISQATLHQNTMVLDDPYHVSRILNLQDKYEVLS